MNRYHIDSNINPINYLKSHRRQAILSFGLFCYLLSGTDGKSEIQTHQQLALLADNTYSITLEGPQRSYCTAVVTADHVLLTADHCLRPKTDIIVSDEKGKVIFSDELQNRVIDKDAETDIARLKAEELPKGYLDTQAPVVGMTGLSHCFGSFGIGDSVMTYLGFYQDDGSVPVFDERHIPDLSKNPIN